MTTYLDFNATSPVLTQVADLVYKIMTEEYGNAGSRTHVFGSKAKQYVDKARGQVAEVVGADKSEVTFTSGATESNNIAILGLKEFAEKSNKKHIITTSIEHKAVLEPIEHLEKNGFEITYINADKSGLIDPEAISNALQEDTLLVSVMHVNNETGCIQPLEEICTVLDGHEAFFHVDAAQSFGKLSNGLENKRIDFISASGHKVYAPKGVGALIARKRGFFKPPLKPIMFGGGQEKGLRPGTLPVQLIAGFGLASEIAMEKADEWQAKAQDLKYQMSDVVKELNGEIIGNNTSPFVMNFSISGVNSEAAIVMLKDIVAVSNGSACTSSSYEPSHVLKGMGINEEVISGAIRVSWSHMVSELPLEKIKENLKKLI